MSRSTRMRAVALAAASLAGAYVAVPASAAASSYSQVVAFGDSLSDTGNILSLTTVLSGLGIPGFTEPLPQDANYFNGRFSNGRVAVEVLADGLKGSMNDGQSLFLQNFAYGGAQTGVNGNDLPTTGMLSQLVSYQKSLAPGVGADPNALYFVWGGGNDLRSISSNPGQANSIIGSALENLGTIVGTLYGMGARHFLVPNLPNLALTPEILGLNSPLASSFAESVSVGFNMGLAFGLFPTLQQSLPGIDLMTVDTLQMQTAIANAPASFGFTNVTEACFTGYVGIAGTECTTPGSHFYWDRVHPTTATHEILGRSMVAAVSVSPVPEPATMLMMATGALALLSLGRRRQR